MLIGATSAEFEPINTSSPHDSFMFVRSIVIAGYRTRAHINVTAQFQHHRHNLGD